jgi:hypothetical protein
MDESVIFRLLDRWWASRQESVGTLTATVYGVPDTSRNLLVTIGDDPTPVPVHRPAMATTPVAGDRVLLQRGPEGFLMATDVLDRDPDVAEEVDVPELPTLEELAAMGVATQDGLDTHAVTGGHLHTYNSLNTMATDDGKWALMASGTLDQRYAEVVFEARLLGGGSNTADWVRGWFRGRLRQQDDFGTDPLTTLELESEADVTASDLVLVVTSNAGPSRFGLYVRVTREYEWAWWVPTFSWARADYASLTWQSCQAWAAALPAGTQTVAS